MFDTLAYLPSPGLCSGNFHHLWDAAAKLVQALKARDRDI